MCNFKESELYITAKGTSVCLATSERTLTSAGFSDPENIILFV